MSQFSVSTVQRSLTDNQSRPEEFNQTSTKLQPDFNTHRVSSRQVCEETEEQTIGLHIRQRARNRRTDHRFAHSTNGSQYATDCFQCCTSHATQGGAQTRLPRTSMKVLQVLRLPRKTSLRCSKCCAGHAKRGGAQSNQLLPGFRRPL